MTNIQSSNTEILLNEEIDRLVLLCTHITQMASRIRLINLKRISYTSANVESSYDSLLSMVEDVEGSAILLESLLTIQKSFDKPKRIHYSREKLFQLKNNVTKELSDNVEDLLRQVVKREMDTENKSWRDIRTILM